MGFEAYLTIHFIKPLTVWLHIHPHYAGLIAFTVAFFESLAIIGGIVPGSVTISAIGILIGTGVIPAISTMMYAIFGAFFGDLVSYGVGYHFQDHIHDLWPFRKYPRVLEKGESFFARHGGKSIFIGRFFGPIRAILPMVAGMMNMKFKRFVIFDFLSALIWAPAYLLPGMILGAAILELSAKQVTRLFLVLLSLILFIGLTVWMLRHFARWIQKHVKIDLMILSGIATSAFIILAYLVIQHQAIYPINNGMYSLLQSIRTPLLDNVMVFITSLFYTKGLIAITVVVGIYLLIKKDYWRSVHWTINGVGIAATVLVSKHFIFSPRPELIRNFVSTSSFPSGHTSMTIGTLGMLAVFLSEKANHWQRKLIWSTTIIVCTLQGFSRIYLGAHWLSDIIAALFIATLWISLTTLSYQRREHRPLNRPTLLLMYVLSLAAINGTYIYRHYSRDFNGNQAIYPTTILKTQAWWQQKHPLLPLIRYSRLGTPQQPLNIQWHASLSQIKNQLEQAGWHVVPKRRPRDWVLYFANADRSQQLPLLAPLYLNQDPTLIMTITLKPQQPLLMLSIWPSKAKFADDSTPLWIGAVHPRTLWHHYWLTHKQEALKKLSSQLDYLKAHLTHWQWKTVSYPVSITHKLLQTSPVDVILIRHENNNAR